MSFNILIGFGSFALSIGALVFQAGMLNQRVSVVERDLNMVSMKLLNEMDSMRRELKELDQKLDTCNIWLAKMDK